MLTLTSLVDNVIFREIGKAAKFDEAAYQGHAVTKVSATNHAADIVARHAKNPDPTKNGRWQNQKHTELSVEINSGNNLYLIRLDPDTRATFGPGPNPVMVLPPAMGANLLNDVCLIYNDAADVVQCVPAAEIPSTLNPKLFRAMLSFTCNRADLEKAWEDAMPDGHKHLPIKVPLFLNLYDIKTGAPVWTFLSQSMHLLCEDNKHLETHGGIHPSHDPHADGSVDMTTHGGIHPSSPSQVLY